MDVELETYLELLERQLQLIRALTVELRQGKVAMTTLDPGVMEKRTLELESICADLTFLAGEIAAIEPNVRKRSVPFSTNHDLLSMRRATAYALKELTQANRVQAALVRRSRRSIDVLMNVLSSCTAECLMSSGASPISRYF